MLNVVICDDSQMQTNVIQALLDKYQSERIEIELYTHSFCSGIDLLNHVDAGNRVDLFLLDILMPGKTGIDFARDLRKRDTEVPLIFLTSSKEHALEAFEVAATQYILKPITKDNLFIALDKIIASFNLEERRFFTMPVQGQVHKISFASIVYAEIIDRSMAVNLLDGRKLISSMLKESFEKTATPLLEDGRFLQPHKSFIVNMAHISVLGNASLTMKNGVQVPVAARKYSEIKEQYLAYLSAHGIRKN